MPLDLMVISPFGAHAIGDRITDAAQIASLLGSENVQNVVQVEPLPASSSGNGAGE